VTVLKRRNIEAALLAKGFRRDNTHHRCFWFFHEGRQTNFRTWTSHGNKEYSGWLLTAIKREMGLATAKQLRDFVACPLSEEEYIQHLQDSDQIRTS